MPETFAIVKHEKFRDTFIAFGSFNGSSPPLVIKLPNNTNVSAYYYVVEVIMPLLELHVNMAHIEDVTKSSVLQGAAHCRTAKFIRHYAKAV